MNFATLLSNASVILSNVAPAFKGSATTAKETSASAANTLGSRADDALDVLVETAESTQKWTLSNLLRAYDAASRLVPMLVPERASKVRNRRIAYATVGGIALGAGAIVVLEMQRPGTLAAFGRKVRTWTGAAVGGVAQEVAVVKETVVHKLGDAKATVLEAADQVSHKVADVKVPLAHSVEAAKVAGEKVKEAVRDGASEVKKDFMIAKDAVLEGAHEVRKDLELAKQTATSGSGDVSVELELAKDKMASGVTVDGRPTFGTPRQG